MARSQRHRFHVQGVNSAGNRRPKGATVPTVAGTNTVGQTLTGTNGTFGGSGTIAITRQWLRNGTPISGATNATYVLQAADSGKKITFRNQGKSRFGSGYSYSAQRTIA